MGEKKWKDLCNKKRSWQSLQRRDDNLRESLKEERDGSMSTCRQRRTWRRVESPGRHKGKKSRGWGGGEEQSHWAEPVDQWELNEMGCYWEEAEVVEWHRLTCISYWLSSIHSPNGQHKEKIFLLTEDPTDAVWCEELSEWFQCSTDGGCPKKK